MKRKYKPEEAEGDPNKCRKCVAEEYEGDPKWLKPADEGVYLQPSVSWYQGWSYPLIFGAESSCTVDTFFLPLVFERGNLGSL